MEIIQVFSPTTTEWNQKSVTERHLGNKQKCGDEHTSKQQMSKGRNKSQEIL